MNNAALLSEVRGMFACCAHGLPEPYLLDVSDLDLPRPKCWGWAPFQGHDEHLQQHIRDRGAWHGPAPIIVLDVESLVTAEGRAGVLQVALHELAHHREWSMPEVASDPAPERVAAALETHNEFAAQPYWEPEGALPLWAADHGCGFVRAALHLHWRANAAGYSVPLGGLCAGYDYGLSHAMHYSEAIGDEPQRMAGATLAEVMAQRAPAAFNRLFSEDVDYWLEKRKT